MHERAAVRFHGWRIAGLAIVLTALTGPGQTIGVAVFIDHLVADLELARSSVSACYLIGTLAGSVTLPRWGQALDRHGVRRMTVVIGLCFAIALAAMAGVQGAVSLAIGFALIRMLGQGALSMAGAVAVAHWFRRRRGFALGLVSTVGGALMAIVPVALNASIDRFGWRSTWLLAATVIGLVVVPIALFGLVDRPGLVGQYVDGDPRPTATGADDDDGGVDRAAALRTPAFWVLAATTACVSMLVTGLAFHQVALMGEAGLSRSQAAAMFLPQVLGAAGAGLATGALIDRLGTRFFPSATMVAMVVTLGAAGVMEGTVSVLVYAILVGAVTGMSRTGLTAVLPAWFGVGHLGSITGVKTIVGVAASALGPVLFTLSADGLGGWRSASIWWTALPGLIGLLALAARPPVGQPGSLTRHRPVHA